MDKVKAELERMKSAGIIKEVIEATDWCTSMVVVTKSSGDVRICVDFKKTESCCETTHVYVAKSRRHSTETSRGNSICQSRCCWRFLSDTSESSKHGIDNIYNTFWEILFHKNSHGISLGPEAFQKKMNEHITKSRWLRCNDGRHTDLGSKQRRT